MFPPAEEKYQWFKIIRQTSDLDRKCTRQKRLLQLCAYRFVIYALIRTANVNPNCPILGRHCSFSNKEKAVGTLTIIIPKDNNKYNKGGTN